MRHYCYAQHGQDMTITDVTKDYTSINVVDQELEEAADIDNESDEGEYVKIYERLDKVCATDAKGTSIRILGGGGGWGKEDGPFLAISGRESTL